MKKNYSFRFDDDLIKQVDELAEKESRSRSNMVKIMIEKYIENEQQN